MMIWFDLFRKSLKCKRQINVKYNVKICELRKNPKISTVWKSSPLCRNSLHYSSTKTELYQCQVVECLVLQIVISDDMIKALYYWNYKNNHTKRCKKKRKIKH